MSLDQIQQSIPSPVNWAVIVGGPLVSLLDVINPVLQAIAFLVGIGWGLFQIWIAYKRKSWRKER